MKFRETYLPKDTDGIKNKESGNDALESDMFNFELDFVEQYEDTDGILHIKTFFNHDDVDESNIWEVFVPKDGSNPLELLLQNS